ncbi:TPA: hypothetical protein QDC20_003798 [Burkholderia aenigmatica]|uniref:hypothetical protein n=1 Tax=Burkholderia sp. AU45251 TaxID=3059204 RepID=UPI002652E90A|nr:hypothetical protein [Burkholderia sp. AU45251]HDR9483622.1 hypothetical protein [Burkholderia aenigmatica]MDN7514559.1 hypothetical protein [Burkholderia sp. AU45251]HDR9515168.1 hypothetical protein [Burkholderia aenigmatica]HDR9592253.1 hypothetical protein [Burkholderia aenigmatica]HDR9600382.1 hypothetical protein [Burkholderia aenigmatica]
MKQKRAYRAAITPPRLPRIATASFMACRLPDLRLSPSGTPGHKITGGGLLANQRIGEKAMKITTDRATLASFKHQRGSQRNRSACRGASSTSAHANRRLPTRYPCSGMERARAAVEQIDVGFPELNDEGESHE